jgi:ANTAR domain
MKCRPSSTRSNPRPVKGRAWTPSRSTKSSRLESSPQKVAGQSSHLGAITKSGIESILSLRLFADVTTMGALNMYSTRIDAFDDRDLAIGTIFAAHAAVAWSTSQKIENLEGGLISRQLIGQAVGLLMARQNVSESEALNVLKGASQRLNIKLRQVAENIVHPDKG